MPMATWSRRVEINMFASPDYATRKPDDTLLIEVQSFLNEGKAVVP